MMSVILNRGENARTLFPEGSFRLFLCTFDNGISVILWSESDRLLKLLIEIFWIQQFRLPLSIRMDICNCRLSKFELSILKITIGEHFWGRQ